MVKKLRPIQSKVKEALFQILGESVNGARFLDLFAGTGSVGIEAARRGAERVSFVDKDPKCMGMIKRALKGFHLKASLHCNDAFSAIKVFHKKGESFDIIFCGPPYKKRWGNRIIKTLKKHPIMKDGGLLIIEHHKREQIEEEEPFSLRRRAEYGETHLSFFQKESEDKRD